MRNLLKLALTAVLALGTMFQAFAQGTASGSVKDAIGPVVGASVLVQGTHNGTVTDMNGAFTLPGVKTGDILEVSCIGYSTQTFRWEGRPVDVLLEEDSEMLEGTVVTALGIRKDEKKVGYAVSSINSDDLIATAAPSLGSALYGKALSCRQCCGSPV